MATMGGSSDPTFVDTNVLIQAAITTAPLHVEAVAKLAALGGTGAELWNQPDRLRPVWGDHYHRTIGLRSRFIEYRKPTHRHREDSRKFSQPRLDPYLAVVRSLAQEEGAAHTTRHAVIPERLWGD